MPGNNRETDQPHVSEDKLFRTLYPKLIGMLEQMSSPATRVLIDSEIIAADALLSLFRSRARNNPDSISNPYLYSREAAIRMFFRTLRAHNTVPQSVSLEVASQLSSQGSDQERSFPLPDSLQKPLDILPRISDTSVRWLAIAADLLVFKDTRPTPENWMRKRQDMLVVVGAVARLSHQKVSDHVEEVLGTPLGIEAVNTRMRRFRQLFNESVALPKKMIPLDQMRAEMKSGAAFGLEIVRAAGIPTIDIYDRPYSSLTDIEKASGVGNLPDEYAQTAKALTEGKKVPEEIEDSLTSGIPNLRNLIRLLGVDRHAILTIPPDTKLAAYQLSPQDVIDRLEEMAEGVLENDALKEIYAHKKGMKSIEQISAESGYTESSVKTYVLRIRKVLESALLFPARLRPVASYKNVGLRLAVHNQLVPSGVFLGRRYVFEEAVDAYQAVKREIDPRSIQKEGITPLREVAISRGEYDFLRRHRPQHLQKHKGRLYIRNEDIQQAHEEYATLSRG